MAESQANPPPDGGPPPLGGPAANGVHLPDGPPPSEGRPPTAGDSGIVDAAPDGASSAGGHLVIDGNRAVGPPNGGSASRGWVRKLTPVARDAHKMLSSPGALGSDVVCEEEEDDGSDEDTSRLPPACAQAPSLAEVEEEEEEEEDEEEEEEVAVQEGKGRKGVEEHACVSRFGACAAAASHQAVGPRHHTHHAATPSPPPPRESGACAAGAQPVSLSQVLNAQEDPDGRLLLEAFLVQQRRVMGNAATSSSSSSAAQAPPPCVGVQAASAGDMVSAIAHDSGAGAAWAAASRAQAEVQRLRELLREKDEQLLRLQREVHKLRSVLQQATSFAQPAAAAPATAPGGKRQGVSGESSAAAAAAAAPDDIHVQRFEKDFRSKQLIKEALMDNDFLKNLDGSQVREMVDSMFPLEFESGAFVVREGDAGSHLFVSAEGELEVLRGGRSLGRLSPGRAFGELAILYNCTRTATVQAVTTARVWALDRRVFQRVMLRQGLRRLRDNRNFLRSVPLLRGLAPPLLHRLADALQLEFFPAGAYVVRQGAPGDTFYIISGGSVRVTRRAPGSDREEQLRTLTRGDYFGERALLREELRTASVQALAPGVELLALDRDSFAQLIGDLSELREREYGDVPSSPSPTPSSSPAPSPAHGPAFVHEGDDTPEDKEVMNARLDDLDSVATLGVGGFGRVELVQLSPGGRSFALKCLKKQHIVDTQQQEHVFNERDIMLACRSPFIVRLYRTFRDSKCVYMLLEACLGGEVWSVLRDRGRFDDATARFVVGCVVEALEYLHAHGVAYRDLKPENLLLDHRGYVKLVDFGFAKRLGSASKTWTFCGTPEYVAPEVILNRGHDRSVDFWALGVLVFELLTGAPPFSAPDPMQTYNLILRGVEAVAFPRHVSRNAESLVRRLCREATAERLGAGRVGLAAVRKHKWFQGFDWDGLQRQTLKPPFAPQIMGPTDTSNFDSYPRDEDIPPDEFSNWDMDF